MGSEKTVKNSLSLHREMQVETLPCPDVIGDERMQSAKVCRGPHFTFLGKSRMWYPPGQRGKGPFGLLSAHSSKARISDGMTL